MTLRYTSRPYAGGRQTSNVWQRFPAGAQPIATAPVASATPVVIYDASGKSFWALSHRDSWQKLHPFKNSHSGAVQWRMIGEPVSQAVAWSPKPLHRR
jgi:hypothetical protein